MQRTSRFGAFIAALFAFNGLTLAQMPTEYDVKAAFLYKMLRFLEWNPARDPSKPIRIGVLGDDAIADSLEKVAGKKPLAGHAVEVIALHRTSEARQTDVVFVSASERRRTPELLKQLAGSGVITVGEIAGFCESGGVINFVLEDNRVQFEVNIESAQRNGISISSKLLRLARSVTR